MEFTTDTQRTQRKHREGQHEVETAQRMGAGWTVGATEQKTRTQTNSSGSVWEGMLCIDHEQFEFPERRQKRRRETGGNCSVWGRRARRKQRQPATGGRRMAVRAAGRGLSHWWRTVTHKSPGRVGRWKTRAQVVRQYWAAHLARRGAEAQAVGAAPTGHPPKTLRTGFRGITHGPGRR